MNDDRENGSFDQEDAEYHLVRPERERSAYSDAYYRSAPQDGRPDYGYNPARYYGRKDASRHRGQIGMRAILILALVCVLAAGALGIGGLYLLGWGRSAPNSALPDFYVQARLPQETAGPILTVPQPTGDAPMSGEDIYVMACPQVVCVSCYGSDGSGIVLSADGYILTNYHVIENAYLWGRTISVVTCDGVSYTAQVTGTETDSDLAVLKIDAEDLSAAEFCDLEDVSVGQQVYAVGDPLGALDYTMTRGTLSAMDRQIAAGENATANMFQFDAAVNRGNSGGPVYNAYGQVIGVVTAKYSASGIEGLGFAIPAPDACAIANELITKGYVSGKAYLGITPDSVSPAVARYFHMTPGAFVKAVEPGSAAETAGLLPGDVITAVDEAHVDGADQLVAALKRYKAGQTAQLSVSRGQQTLTLSVTFDEAPPPAQ